jgi:hypothetical protein
VEFSGANASKIREEKSKIKMTKKKIIKPKWKE